MQLKPTTSSWSHSGTKLGGGGLLSTKSQEIYEWEAVKNNLWKKLQNETVHIDVVLTLSFKDLPLNLKQCFLYIAKFPEDYKIYLSRLTALWEAEGFVEESEEFCSGEVAKSYFDELVGRSLLQKIDEDWGDPVCHVLDLLRDLAIKKANETGFCVFSDESQTSNLSKAPYHRRPAICDLPTTIIPRDYTNKSIRTLFIEESGWKFVADADPEENKVLRSVHKRFSLLRVPDIAVMGKISKIEVGKLAHLRYIGLHSGTIKLSNSMGGLKYLKTVCITAYGPVYLPRSVVKLKSLKHLIGNLGFRGGLIGQLTDLETVSGLSIHFWCKFNATSLVNICYLCLTDGFIDADYTRFCSNLECLPRLHVEYNALVKLVPL